MANGFIEFTKEQLNEIDRLIEEADKSITFASKMGMDTSGMKADLRKRVQMRDKMRKAVEETENGM